MKYIKLASKWAYLKLCKGITGCCKAFMHKEMPLGVSIILFLATALFTYFLTPQINQEFEKQKIISQFVTENLNDFNMSCRSLIANTSVLVHNLDDGYKANRELKNKIRSEITDLQWRAIQLDVIFKNDKSAKVISEYKSSLTDLGKAVEQAKTSKDTDLIAMRALIFTDKSVKVMDALASKAGLRIDSVIAEPAGKR